MIKIHTFQEAIEHSANRGKRNLLLGNGFSIACQPDVFRYESLLEKAPIEGRSRIRKVFKMSNSTDFEGIIKLLESSEKVLKIYSPKSSEHNAGIRSEIKQDAHLLRKILVKVIATNHPETPGDISEEMYSSCRKFLRHFIESKTDTAGRIYTTNYDLLLYWTLLHELQDVDARLQFELEHNDGFGRDRNTPDEYVKWMGESSAQSQRVHYLHGAIHLFDDGTDIYKYTWSRTGTRILQQIEDALRGEKYPLFVAEGTSQQKLKTIKHNPYLYHSYKSFSKIMGGNSGSLFVLGFSFSNSDQHIIDKIVSGGIRQLYVGVHGNKNSDGNKRMVRTLSNMMSSRRKNAEMDVMYFDSAGANVWNAESL